MHSVAEFIIPVYEKARVELSVSRPQSSPHRHLVEQRRQVGGVLPGFPGTTSSVLGAGYERDSPLGKHNMITRFLLSLGRKPPNRPTGCSG